jgi:hypothetical protein
MEGLPMYSQSGLVSGPRGGVSDKLQTGAERLILLVVSTYILPMQVLRSEGFGKE